MIRRIASASDDDDDRQGKDFPEPELRAQRDLPPLLPDGIYDAQCLAAEVAQVFRRRVLFLHFQIFGGPHDGARTFMKLNLPPGRAIGLSSAFYRAWTVASGTPPRRRDRMSLEVFRRIFRVRLRTVARDHAGQAKPEILCYSVVAELVERLA